jgi:hypothetical protein
MERVDEKPKTKESACGSTGKARGASAQQGQAVGQSGKWPQGRFGQKPEEENCSPSQRATSTPRSPEKLIEIVIASICARFGDCAIGRGSWPIFPLGRVFQYGGSEGAAIVVSSDQGGSGYDHRTNRRW